MSLDLTDRCVLVTGASSGIGRACVEAFAGLGCRLILLARRADRLQALAVELETNHAAEVLTAVVDVRSRSSIETWFGGLPDGWRDIDILVNNAGLARGLTPLHEGEVSDWEEMIDTNIKGLLYMTRTVLPAMVDRGTGHVINIGSIAGHEVYPGGSVYCATKHAVTAINRTLAIDTLGTGVRVSSIDPGLVETEFSLVRFHGDKQRAEGVYKGLEPLRGKDVADAVVFCATRPLNANIRELILTAGAQASAVHTYRTS